MSENTGAYQGGRFRKGVSGNPAGKPKGTRHRATLAAEALLDGEAEKLTRRAIEKALEGDASALRLCLERILPTRKERPLHLALPVMNSAADAALVMARITAAVAIGDITAGEGADLSTLVSSYVKALEMGELEKRVAMLEQKAISDVRKT